MYKNTHKGKFVPKNKHKYAGDVNNIIYRSGLELKFLLYLDKHPDIIKYWSEESVIPYVSPIDGKAHRYFVDFYIKYRNKEGIMKEALVEVKPKSQCSPPKIKTKMTNKYLREVQTWGINDAKWKAAREYCKQRNMDFIIMTEQDLGVVY